MPKPRRAGGYAVEQLEDELLLFHPGRGSIVALNPAAVLVWNLCDGVRTAGEIADLIAAAYPEAADRVHADVDEIVALLAGHGALEAAGD